MKKGIEILINEFSAKLETPEDMEFNRLKKSVQESIQNAINNSQLDVAASLIKEYEDIVGVDASLCAFKGIMHMINGNYEAARDNFLLGLKLEPDNEDLIYNLNYLDDIGQAK